MKNIIKKCREWSKQISHYSISIHKLNSFHGESPSTYNSTFTWFESHCYFSRKICRSSPHLRILSCSVFYLHYIWYVVLRNVTLFPIDIVCRVLAPLLLLLLINLHQPTTPNVVSVQSGYLLIITLIEEKVRAWILFIILHHHYHRIITIFNYCTN